MIKLVITYLNDENKTEVLISVVWKNSHEMTATAIKTTFEK